MKSRLFPNHAQAMDDVSSGAKLGLEEGMKQGIVEGLRIAKAIINSDPRDEIAAIDAEIAKRLKDYNS